MKENYLITWFYAEKEDDESYYPSVGGNTSAEEFQRVYWCCVYDFFKSAKLTQSNELKYMLFTNVEKLPSDIYGIDMDDFIKELGVEVIHLELSYKTPKDWYGAWRNQFYIFDILKYLHEQKQGNYLILDSDVFITKDLQVVFKDVEEKGVVTYECGYDDTYEVNGISNIQMKKLYEEFASKKTDRMVKYKGGEFIGISSRVLPELLKCYGELWTYNYKLYEMKKSKLNEEAHFLSVIYHYLGFYESVANKYVKRMWTSIRCDNVKSGDEDLWLWHLPAEKKYLFVKMAQYMGNDITKEEYLYTLKKWSGIPGLSIARRLRKMVIKFSNAE